MATKQLALRRDDHCASCSAPLAIGMTAQWDSIARSVTCLPCVAEAEPLASDTTDSRTGTPEPRPLDLGEPGRSARQEHDRRRARGEARIEKRWGTGRLGKMAKFLSDDPQTTKAWAAGASGEERVAQVLHERLGASAVLLHDRKVPGTRGNIDHLAIASSGVWVIDTKRYSGKVEQRDVGGWFKTDLRLYVGGRDRTGTVKGLGWQVDAVYRALEAEDIPIHSALSFAGAKWPILFAQPFRLQDVWISWPAKLADLIAAPGTLSGEDIDRLARRLSVRLPSK